MPEVNTRIKSIPTWYKGVLFRSRLEAVWASWLDLLGIAWVYETEGVDLEGIWYLPDFYLPGIKTWLEVKGVLDDSSDEKILALNQAVNRTHNVVVGYSNGKAEIVRTAHSDIEVNYGDGSESPHYSEAVVMSCVKCHKYWFATVEGGYGCRNCGYWDGDDLYSWEVMGEGFSTSFFTNVVIKSNTLLRGWEDEHE